MEKGIKIDDFKKRKEEVIEEKRRRHTKCKNCEKRMKKNDMTISVYITKGVERTLAGSFCSRKCQKEYELVKMERKFRENW